MKKSRLDGHRGRLPEILSTPDSVTFNLPVTRMSKTRLVVRCDTDGNVYAAIVGDETARTGGVKPRT